MSSRIPSPRPPELPPQQRFPLFATIAPMAASVALWAITQSAYALVFAALGPVVAVAAGFDSRLQRRRVRKRETARFHKDCARAKESIFELHERQRQRLLRFDPALTELSGSLARNPHRWRGDVHDTLRVRVGSGDVSSEVEFDEPALTASGERGSVDDALTQLSDFSSTVPRAPITALAAGGIGVAGPPRLTAAVARAAVVRCSIALSPSQYVVSAPADDEWGWVNELPHERVAAARDGCVVFARSERGVRDEANSQQVIIAVANEPASLPRDVGSVIEISATAEGRFILLADPVGEDTVGIEPDFMAREHAMTIAAELSRLAAAEGVIASSRALPEIVELAELVSNAALRERPPGLRCSIGAAGDGPVDIDLVADGPHAIVGGTTGSGKSELLLSWMLSMAATRSPSELTFLFVDFKGGASFDPLADLPHCVGVITDLDVDESVRALTSLGAELRFRERALAEFGLRSIDDAVVAPPFARLVVVVDEYAALVESHAGLHAVFVDIAARGRSLGVHLVLCTQRPAGIVREAILANAGLRISLRVNSRADSTAVITTDAAARLPAKPVGRALVSVAGSAPQALQVARSATSDVTSVIHRWVGLPAPRRPWCAPLPHVIPLGSIDFGAPTGRVPFCVVDRPDIQSQELGSYDPASDGSLLVVGAAGSGKSRLIAALAQSPSTTERIRVGRDLPSLWDALVGVLAPEVTRAETKGRLLLIDGVDEILSACPEEYASALLELLARVLREGPAHGVHSVLTVQRIPGMLQSAASLCGSRVVLRTPSRQEHVLSGGESVEFSAELPPGSGHWRGRRIQVVLAEDSDRDVTIAPSFAEVDTIAGSVFAVVSGRPELFAAGLSGAGSWRRCTLLRELQPGSLDVAAVIAGTLGVLVGDPESWQMHWNLFAALKGRVDVIFDGCSLLEFRTLTRMRELPPPSGAGERPLWRLATDGALGRARLVGLNQARSRGSHG